MAAAGTAAAGLAHGRVAAHAGFGQARLVALPELGLLAAANVHAVGRQIDPAQARRDLLRLQEWTIGPTEGSASDGFATAQ